MIEQPLWTAEAMAQAMRGRRSGVFPGAITGLSIDSRTLKAGEAFFAISGNNRDGHDFVEAALNSGAALAVVSKTNGIRDGAPLILVDDVLVRVSTAGGHAASVPSRRSCCRPRSALRLALRAHRCDPGSRCPP